MFLLIDIGNTRIKWQYRDEKNVISSNSVLVENFMDIDLTEIINEIESVSPRKKSISGNDMDNYVALELYYHENYTEYHP